MYSVAYALSWVTAPALLIGVIRELIFGSA